VAEEKQLWCFFSHEKIQTVIEVAREVFGPREAVLAREKTKIHEEFIRETLIIWPQKSLKTG
jgi:16S rRNA C1402 (ribose-2'-O) methylase RsmI